jgi:hypothetical protein
MMEPPKSPWGYELAVYFWVLLLSTLGGFVSFMRKLKEGKARAFNVAEFIGEIATSAFAGMITFFMCQWAGFADLLTAAMVAVSGHMGSRAIFMFEQWAEKKFENLP